MPYQVTTKRLMDGQWLARCMSGPNGVVAKEAPTKKEAVEKLREEIRYQLEFCPCSSVAQDFVQLDVRDE